MKGATILRVMHTSVEKLNNELEKSLERLRE